MGPWETVFLALGLGSWGASVRVQVHGPVGDSFSRAGAGKLGCKCTGASAWARGRQFFSRWGWEVGVQVYGCKCMGPWETVFLVLGLGSWGASVRVQVHGPLGDSFSRAGAGKLGCKCTGASAWALGRQFFSCWGWEVGVQVYGCKCMGP